MSLRLLGFALTLLLAAGCASTPPSPPPAAATAAPPTLAYIVRHAEKAAEPADDPPLTEAGRRRAELLRELLRDVPVGALYATDTVRAQQTVAPLEEAIERRAVIVARTDTEAVANRLRMQHPGETVVVAAHSDTIPELLQRLGVASPPSIPDDDYDDIFLVVLSGGTATLQHLHYPGGSP